MFVPGRAGRPRRGRSAVLAAVIVVALGRLAGCASEARAQVQADSRPPGEAGGLYLGPGDAWWTFVGAVLEITHQFFGH